MPQQQDAVITQHQEAAKSLKEILPKLEQTCENVRRSLATVSENFQTSRKCFETAMKTGVLDESVMEFLYAATEFDANLSPLLEVSQQIEAATGQLVKGAQEMAATAVKASETTADAGLNIG